MRLNRWCGDCGPRNMRKRASFAPSLRLLATTLRRFPMALAADVAMSSLCRPGRAGSVGARFHGEAGSAVKLGSGGGVIRGCCFGGGLKRGGREATRCRVAARIGGLDVRLEENLGTLPMMGDAVGELIGKPAGSPKFSLHDKLVVAVDVDEVLGSFLSALNRYIADRYCSNHSLAEYHVYEFFKIWNCSRIEADIRVHEFFRTPYFKLGIHPIPGAQHALLRLSTFCNLSVVTSRQNAIKDLTIDWIEKHYPGLFQEIHFGNHFALDGLAISKSNICRSFGAQVLIDDNPRYAIECAEAGIKVLLFDYNNSYPWCKSCLADQHPLVTKVHNWQEVEHHLVSLVPSL